MAEDKDGAEAAVSEVHKKISAAFNLFDDESNTTVDVREVGTIIRSLGCFPTEAELHEILTEIEDEELTGLVRLEKFLPVMTKVLMERKFRPVPEELLLQAFEVLDQEKKGYLEPEELKRFMTQEVPLHLLNINNLCETGEPFSNDEMEEMLSAAVDPDKNVIFYKDFVGMMTVRDP
ncbi:dynein regulatory complex protein 8 isoform X1 [Conger conger]|uniref:dynein regulatory complex protein 8 isoform X1 n=1 Tax=Conger conger TaxID=82655 RepID=UPI002A599F4F|nr:dynein regulatory complex protein 8 isoform X1 [Conger conger]